MLEDNLYISYLIQKNLCLIFSLKENYLLNQFRYFLIQVAFFFFLIFFLNNNKIITLKFINFLNKKAFINDGTI